MTFRLARPGGRAAGVGALALAALLPTAAAAGAAGREQSTQLISRALDGGLPNGASTNAVISGDRRWAGLIAFQSDASDLTPGDANGASDVFAVTRAGSYGNDGSPWRPGRTVLVSRGLGGTPANGASFAPSVDGSFTTRASCVGFLSAASNLVRGDTNGAIDAFVARPGGPARRVSLPGGRQSSADATGVAVSGDCSKIAFVAGGELYVRSGSRTVALATPGEAEDPSWSTGQAADGDLVYGARDGVYLSAGGTRKGKLVAPGGRNPAYNNLKRQTLAYETRRSGSTQIATKDLGQRETIASAYRGSAGNADSRNPVIGNSGYYVAFESDASNLQTDAAGRRRDTNGAADAYLFTEVRNITLLQSVQDKGVALPGGGRRPSMSFYANYLLFDTPGPIGAGGARQVYMRYLGAV